MNIQWEKRSKHVTRKQTWCENGKFFTWVCWELNSMSSNCVWTISQMQCKIHFLFSSRLDNIKSFQRFCNFLRFQNLQLQFRIISKENFHQWFKNNIFSPVWSFRFSLNENNSVWVFPTEKVNSFLSWVF